MILGRAPPWTILDWNKLPYMWRFISDNNLKFNWSENTTILFSETRDFADDISVTSLTKFVFNIKPFVKILADFKLYMKLASNFSTKFPVPTE